MFGDGWLIVREPNEEERKSLMIQGIDPDSVEIVFKSGKPYVRPVDRATSIIVNFLNELAN